MVTTDDIRSWAMGLPEVTEKEHFRFKVPVWQVRGKTFVGMGRGEASVVCCVTEESANAAAAADPGHVAAVRRMDARRSFLGLEVQLAAGLSAPHVKALVHEAWVARAPKTLVKQHLERI